MPPTPFLTVWCVLPPQSGPIDPPALSTPLAHPRRYDACFAPIHPGGRNFLQILDVEAGVFLSPASEPSPGQSGAHTAVTLLGVTNFAFHANGGVPDVSDFAGQCAPQLPPAVSGYVGRLPMDRHDPPPGNPQDHRYARLSQTAAAPFALLRLTRFQQAGADLFPQFLMFRFPFRAPILGDSQGDSRGEDGGSLNPAFLQSLLRSGNAASANDAALKVLGRAEHAAEQREAGARRMPYIAGVVSCDAYDTAPYIESFAGNAAMIGLADALGATHDHADGGSQDWVPRAPDRVARNGDLADGYWWAWAQSATEPTRPTLAQHLRGIGDHPQSALHAPRKVLTTLFGDDPAAPAAPIAPDLAALDFLGLTAAAAVPAARADALNGRGPPVHYLHARLDGADLEWRRWLMLEPTGTGSATPALLRVRGAPSVIGRGDYTLTIEGLTDAHVLGLWSRQVAEPLRALARERGSRRSLSLLPNIEGAATSAREVAHGGRWVVRLTCRDDWPALARLVSSQSQPSWPEAFVSRVEVFQSPTHADGCAPAGAETHDYFETPPPAPPAAAPARLAADELVFTELCTHSGAPLRLGGGSTAYAVSLDSPLAFAVGASNQWTLTTPHELAVTVAGAGADGQTVALGGLDLDLNGQSDEPALGFRIAIQRNDDPLAYTVGGAGGEPMALTVAAARVGGTDEVALAPASQPLLWADGPLAEAATLRCTDLVDPDVRRRRTTFALHATGSRPTSSEIAVTILDASPMVVAQVAAEKLGAASANGDTIATWNSEEAFWRLVWTRAEHPTSTLTLPPQGVAEAWERRAHGAPSNLPDDQIAPGERVPARLTPAARFVLESEERERNPIAPWNLRHLMTDLTADLPGARLTRISQFEALYGLEARRDEVTGLRLAELAAWRGAPRAPPAGRSEVRFQDWTAARGAWEDRLAVYDLRPEDDPLQRPRVEDVAFKLRSRAEGAKYAKSIVQPLPNDGEVWTDPAQGGILGGAMAGFEQVSVIKALLRDAANGRGDIDGLQLSALGAWTRPRATFNNDLTRITADLEMGRVHEARFERVGRIAGLHHIAKHVIVYRRSFEPSAQFAAEQDPHLGRPIMRKAEEFIELVQKVRTYPDRTGATPQSSGWLLGARFRTIRIPVHGSWASPIDDPRFEGYAIPLWRDEKDLTQAEKTIYPRPVIEALVASDPNLTDPEPPARRIADPQKLRFYTITSVKAAGRLTDPDGDPENWPYVYWLDTINRPLRTPVSDPLSKADFRSPAGAAVKLPPADELPAGLEAFTVRLEAGPGINVSQARNAKPMLADIRTVTLLRGTPLAADATSDQAGKAFAGLAQAPQPVARLADIARQARDGAITAAEALARGKAEVAALKAMLPDKKSFDPRSICLWAHEPARRARDLAEWLNGAAGLLPTQAVWDKQRLRVLAPLDALSDRLRATLPFQKAIDAQLDPVIEQARSALANLVAAGDHEIGALDQAATDAIARLGELTNGWRNSLLAARANCDDPTKDLIAQFDELQRKVRDETDRLRTAARAATDTIEGTNATFQNAAASGREALARAVPGGVSTYDAVLSGLQGAADKALRIARALDTAVGQFSFDLGALMARARNASVQEITDLRAKIVAALDAAAAAVAAAGAWQTDTLTTLLNQLRAQATSARQAIMSQLSTPLDALIAQARGLSIPVSAAADTALQGLLDEIDAIRRAAADDVAPYPQATIATLSQGLAALQTTISTAATQLDVATAPICNTLTAADAWLDSILDQGQDAFALITAELDAAQGDLQRLADKIGKAASAFDKSLGQLRQGVEDVLDGKALDRILSGSPVQPKDLGEALALNVLRAAGAPPIVEQLAFNRDRIAYYFEQETNRILVTPVTALMDQADQALKGIGLTLPTLAIGDSLLAPANRVFDDVRDTALTSISMKAQEVLQDFASLKQMLPNLQFDGRLASGVVVTHDYDPKRNVAWLQADVNYGPDTQDLFRADGFAVTAENMLLQGRSRYERNLSGGESRSVKASVTSNWVLEIGGTRIVRIRDAAIRYDASSGLSFDIKPENIEFNELLKMFSDAIAAFGGGDKPLKLELLMDETTGRPIGLSSRYDLPPTTFGFGVVTIMNASLGVHLDIAQRAEFEIRAFAYFGRQDSPFSFIVTWLGGGGYLEAEARYLPASGRTDLDLRISIGACAGIGFTFGPLAGKVQVYLGFEATYLSSSTGSHLTIAAVIVIDGAVTAWGFITIGLGMRLALTYEGSQTVGRGHVDVSVRISCFYTQSFSSPINYRL